MLAKRVLFHKTYYQLTKITKKVRKTNKESTFNPSVEKGIRKHRKKS